MVQWPPFCLQAEGQGGRLEGGQLVASHPPFGRPACGSHPRSVRAASWWLSPPGGHLVALTLPLGGQLVALTQDTSWLGGQLVALTLDTSWLGGQLVALTHDIFSQGGQLVAPTHHVIIKIYLEPKGKRRRDCHVV